MARTVSDVRLLFQVLAGYDMADPFSAPIPLRKAVDFSGCVGVMEQFLDNPVEEAMRAAVRMAAKLLSGSGMAVEEFRPSGLEAARDTWWFFFGELSAAFTRQALEGRESDAHWTSTELLGMVPPERNISGREVVERLGARDRMRSVLFRQMERFPVLLMPAAAAPAFAHRRREWDIDGQKLGLLDLTSPVTPWNLLGMPGLTVPMSVTPDGLPIGVQLVARPFEEELLLHIGEVLEEARGKFPAPPGFD
jgi:Asp-tRNA(Asn)/Glu-tRNA(Gln) amidotransferase A subunit family amidase